MNIILQQQPTADSCMVTCLAMVINEPVQQVYDQWHPELFDKTCWLDDVLDRYYIPYFYGQPRKAKLTSGFVYFLTVASLNIEGGLHQILLKHDAKGNVTIYDPVKGRPGTRSYVVGLPENPSEVTLITWVVDLALPIF